MVIDEEKNFENYEYMKNALNQENNYFSEQIKYIIEMLDKMTDLCETPSFLDIEMLKNLDSFFDTYYSFLDIEMLKNLDSFFDTYYQDILANIEKYYIEYKDNNL